MDLHIILPTLNLLTPLFEPLIGSLGSELDIQNI